MANEFPLMVLETDTLIRLSDDLIERTGRIVVRHLKTRRAELLCERDGCIPDMGSEIDGEFVPLPPSIAGLLCARCRKPIDQAKWNAFLAESAGVV